MDGAALAATRAARLHHDLLDERANRVPRCRAIVGGKVRVEFGDRTPVKTFVVCRQAHNLRRWRRRNGLLQAALLGFKVLHPRRQCARGVFVIFNLANEIIDAGAGFRQFVLSRGTLDISSLCHGGKFQLQERREALDESRREQPFANTRQRAGFQFRGGDRAVGACARAMPLAAPPPGAGRQERGAARAASHQPGE
ncbi:hypothetical protein QP176_00400 [Sphingomonas aerolata]